VLPKANVELLSRQAESLRRLRFVEPGARERFFDHRALQIAVGGGDDARIGSKDTGVPEPLELSLLENVAPGRTAPVKAPRS
jgi:hypothetical protein